MSYSKAENQTFLNLTFLKSRVPGAHMGPHGGAHGTPWGPRFFYGGLYGPREPHFSEIQALKALDLRKVWLRNVWFSAVDILTFYLIPCTLYNIPHTLYLIPSTLYLIPLALHLLAFTL